MKEKQTEISIKGANADEIFNLLSKYFSHNNLFTIKLLGGTSEDKSKFLLLERQY